MSRQGVLGAACALVLIGGCQTSSEGVSAFTANIPFLGSGPSRSNEPNRRGRIHLAAGNFGLAERQFQDAVEKDRQDADSWIGLAAAYDNLARFDLADRAYVQALRIRGETFEILNNLGYSYMLRGDGARALAKFELALALDPGNPVILNNMRLLRLGVRPSKGSAL